MSSPATLWLTPGDKAALEHGDRLMPAFDKDGLLPAIAVDHETREILMVAWMNADALRLTLTTGYAHFWSRSRKRIWLKGEESGNKLLIRKALTDCDQDVLVVEVEIEGDGVACHTGARSCFYRRLMLDEAGAEPVRLVDEP